MIDAISEDVSVPLHVLQKKIYDDLHITASLTTINSSLKDMNYSLKRVAFVPERRNALDVINTRESYCSDYMLQDEEKLIFVDEFGVSCSTRVAYGRSLVGPPARKPIRSIRSKNISVCAAVMKSGVKYFKIRETAYNSGSFLEFLSGLISSLRDCGVISGTVIMDNATIHKNTVQRSFLMSNGFDLVFLPAYTPQLNLIEELFSKWKHCIARLNPRTLDDLYNNINEAAGLITPEDCNGFYHHVREFALKGIRREEF